MTRLDLSPFRAMTVGFDSLFNDIADFRPSSYPPYNIEKVGDCEYKLTFAVAGFSEKVISVTQKESTLAIEGELSSSEKLNSSTSGGPNSGFILYSINFVNISICF